MNTSKNTNVLLSVIATLLAVNIVTTIFRPGTVNAATAGAMQYNFGYWNNIKEVVPNLDDMGKKGWRVIGYTATSPDVHFFVFERPLR